MKLFSSSLRPANHSISSPVAILRERQLSLEDDYHSIIQAFEPESIMAEQASENNIVLAQAIENCSGYGLFYPDITALDQTLLLKRCAKIILLEPESSSIQIFERFGSVVFDLADYQQAVRDLVYQGAFIFDDE